MLGLPGDPGRIAFMLNATHALNTALFGTLCQGDVVVISQYDHNAVLRPVHQLAVTRGVEVRMLSGNPEGTVDLDQAEQLLVGAKVLVVNAASNVLGTVLPLADLAERAHAAGAVVLLDAAQSAGHLVESPADAGADMVALTGHKGLLGPQGTGALWVREGLDITPLCSGGTGGDSSRREMPELFPDRLEAGTQNAPGIAGLAAGIDFVVSEGADVIHRRTQRLKAQLRSGLQRIPGIEVVSPSAPDGVAVVTVRSTTVDPPTLAGRLDREWGVMVRHGLHCAPEAHRVLGTFDTGAVRYSLGWASTEEDVERALEGTEAVTTPAQTVAG